MKIIRNLDVVVINKEIRLPCLKDCGSCHRSFDAIPVGAKYANPGNPLEGYDWQCSCGSNVFMPMVVLMGIKKKVA